jgi:hypothetical protein
MRGGSLLTDSTKLTFTVRGVNRFNPVVAPLPPMNESETRAELIDSALKAAGWGV